ncbi:YIP1 family protein, partial [Nanoarchaeota archaeon]
MFEGEANFRFIDKIKYIIRYPREFFEAIRMEDKLSTAVVFLVSVQLMLLPFYILIAGLILKETSGILISNWIMTIVASFGMLFMTGLIYHISITIFGGRAGIKRSMQAFIYGSIPVVLVSWI